MPTLLGVNKYAAVNLKVVFLPLLIFEVIILIDNFRALLAGDDDSMSDEIIWETLPHFWVAISMVFFVAATVFTLLMLSDIHFARSLPIKDFTTSLPSFIAECFAFLVCTKWSNLMIHRISHPREASSSSSSSSSAVRYLDWNSGLVVSSEGESQDRICSLQDIVDILLKFQSLAFKSSFGTHAAAKNTPLPIIFSPLLVLQGAGFLIAASRLVENIVILLRSGTGTGRYFVFSSRVQDCFGFLHHGSRYTTFCGYPPEMVKKCSRRILLRRFGDFKLLLVSKQKLQNTASRSTKDFKISCCEKCKKCPIFRVVIEDRLPVYDV